MVLADVRVCVIERPPALPPHPNTPGLEAALDYNAQVMAEGRWPESLGLPSILDDAGMVRLDAIMKGALIIELEARIRRETRSGNMAKGKYLQLEMPDEFVVWVKTEDDLWFDSGSYKWADFVEDDKQPGVYVSTFIGMPFFLRVTSIDGDVYTVEDGGGNQHVYRIAPVSTTS